MSIAKIEKPSFEYRPVVPTCFGHEIRHPFVRNIRNIWSESGNLQRVGLTGVCASIASFAIGIGYYKVTGRLIEDIPSLSGIGFAVSSALSLIPSRR